MILETDCPDCQTRLVRRLPPTTTETEAESIAARLYCSPCAIKRMAETTARTCDTDAGQFRLRAIGDGTR